MKARFYGGPLDGWNPNTVNIGEFGDMTDAEHLLAGYAYDLTRIDRQPGPDGIDESVAVYEVRR